MLLMPIFRVFYFAPTGDILEVSHYLCQFFNLSLKIIWMFPLPKLRQEERNRLEKFSSKQVLNKFSVHYCDNIDGRKCYSVITKTNGYSDN